MQDVNILEIKWCAKFAQYYRLAKLLGNNIDNSQVNNERYYRAISACIPSYTSLKYKKWFHITTIWIVKRSVSKLWCLRNFKYYFKTHKSSFLNSILQHVKAAA